MGSRLLVGNLGAAVNGAQLEALLASHGQVTSQRIVINEDSDSHQRSAYVQMFNDEDARRAILALHGQVIDGRALSISDDSAVVTPVAVVVPGLRPRYGNGRSGGMGIRSGRRV
jgi:RNA recognition motif-containing protein